jgi:hypothetical protein
MAETDEGRIRVLEDQLRVLRTFREGDKHQIAQLKAELSEAHQLIDELRDNAQDYRDTMESWRGAFYMELTDNAGTWREATGVWEAYDALVEKYRDLVTRWNRNVDRFNAIAAPKNIGRPLAASEAQIARVRALKHKGMSIRGISDETSLGMQTVRTIIGHAAGNDRATMKRMERIDPEHAMVREWRGKKRTRQALPKKIEKFIDDADRLIKAAKGLGG